MLIPHIDAPPGMPDALCLDHPEGWDIEALGHDAESMNYAANACRTACAEYWVCLEWTTSLEKADAAPNGVIQAGNVYGNARRAKA